MESTGFDLDPIIHPSGMHFVQKGTGPDEVQSSLDLPMANQNYPMAQTRTTRVSSFLGPPFKKTSLEHAGEDSYGVFHRQSRLERFRVGSKELPKSCASVIQSRLVSGCP